MVTGELHLSRPRHDQVAVEHTGKPMSDCHIPTLVGNQS